MKKNLTILLIFCFSLTGLLNAQTDPIAMVIQKEWNAISVKSAVSIYDNGYLMAAEYNNNAAIVKLDSYTEIEWAKAFVEQNHYLNTIIELPDSCYLLGGRYYNSQTQKNNLFLTKIDIWGDTIWNKMFFNENSIYIMSSSLTADSGFIVSGYELIDYNDYNIFVSKFDRYGDIEWHKVINITDYVSKSYSAREMSDNSIIVTGSAYNSQLHERNTVIVNLSATGEISWLKNFDISYSTGYDIIETETGFQVLCNNNSYLELVHCNETGIPHWAKKYDASSTLESYFNDVESPKLCLTDRETYLIANNYDMFNGYILELSNNGEVIDGWANWLITQNVIKNNNGNYLAYGNGPLMAVKNGDYYGELQIGVIQGEPGNFDTECGYQNTGVSYELDTITVGTLNWTESSDVTVASSSINLESIDLNYRFGCVDIIGAVDETKNNNTLSVFPNPASTSFTIQSQMFENNEYTIRVTDMLGKTVSEVTNSSKLSVEIVTNGWNKGIYFIRVSEIGKEIGSKKVVIE